VSDLVTLGEAMGLLVSTEPVPLRYASTMHLTMAGSESNVAIGVRRLGCSTAWLGRVGDDELGRLVLGRLRAEGVEVGSAVVDEQAPTGLMLKEHRTAQLVRVLYYRQHSAGSRLRPDDLDAELIRSARVLHVTGITPALSESAREAVRAAVAMARASRVTVSLDFNYRSALWTRKAATAELAELVRFADVVFAGEDEASLLVTAGTPEEAALALTTLGPAHAAIKCGPEGAVLASGGRTLRAEPIAVPAVDPVGAGDAFVAGYLAGLLEEAGPEECLRMAAAAGAFAVTVAGDWEGLPTRSELVLLEQAEGAVLR
jgi:2-dehydro-3-deoxygluconokinase